MPSSWAFAGPEGKCVFGFADGSVILAEVTFATEYLEDDDVPAEFHDLGTGDRRSGANGSAGTDAGRAAAVPGPGVQAAMKRLPLGDAPIELLDLSRTSSGFALAALDSAGVFHHRTLTLKTNMLTGKVKVRSRGGELDPGRPDLGSRTTYSAI